MNQNVVYVGIDVDDVSYHGSALDRHTGEVLDFRSRPTLKGLLRQIKNLDEILEAYGEEIEALAVTPRYQEPIKALTLLRQTCEEPNRIRSNRRSMFTSVEQERESPATGS